MTDVFIHDGESGGRMQSATLERARSGQPRGAHAWMIGHSRVRTLRGALRDG